ncbi:hypothetical protein D915_002682 [Fasciola hepatica]|uniref:Uncharacterized protein n=1 Tax=Fasciola hepatica TaxID=6192 RepID=A0A4E0S1P0_FASHE|nr:hypothetical protein D915_002682 [Fasciola hepatica]
MPREVSHLCSHFLSFCNTTNISYNGGPSVSLSIHKRMRESRDVHNTNLDVPRSSMLSYKVPKNSGRVFGTNQRPTDGVDTLRKADIKQQFILLTIYNPLDSEEGS